MTASSIIDTAIVLRVNFDTWQIVVESNVVSFIVLRVARLMCSTLNDIAFRKPELGRLEDVNFLVSLGGQWLG